VSPPKARPRRERPRARGPAGRQTAGQGHVTSVPPHHPSRYQLLPPLSDIEREALKSDIRERGVLVPVEKDDKGHTLDGHHREELCEELGITDYPVIVRPGLSEEAKIEHVLKINLVRRHLGPIGWAEAFRRLLSLRGVELGRGKRNDLRGGTSDRASEVAKELGVDPRTARRRLRLADALASHPDLAADVDAGKRHAERALTLAREREVAARRAPRRSKLPATADIRRGDFREILADLPSESVDLIFTDPPWTGEAMPIFADLGAFAARVLKPSGLLLVEIGQMYLGEAIKLLEPHLAYHWCISIYLPGQNVRVHARQAINSWRPILVYSSVPKRRGRWIVDSYRVEDRPDKTWHPWQKALGPARSYIEALTDPGDLVVDPFLGSGSTAVAAVELGRRFVGCDVDSKAIKASRIRVADAAKERAS
jgi:site-specific DNA-methyltransferase (adenine-specific)